MTNEININVCSFLLKFEKSHRYNNKPLIIEINSSDGIMDWDFLTKSEIQDLINFLKESINE